MAAAPLGLLAVLLLQAGTIDVPSMELERAESRPEPVRYGLGLRTEVRTYGGPTTDVEVDPSGAVRVPFRNAGLTLVYDPRIFIIAGPTPQHVSYVHRGRLGVDGQPGPRWTLFLKVEGGYGEYDFNPLSTVLPKAAPSGTTDQVSPSGPTPSVPVPTTPIPSVSSLPDRRLLRVVDVSATAGGAYLLSPRVSWLLSGGYMVSGGLDATAQQSLPLQQGPLVSTGTRWSLSPTDTLQLLLAGSDTRFSSGPEAAIVNLTTTWSHALSGTWQADLTGGAGAFHSTGPDRPVNNSVLPVGGLGVTHTWLRKTGNVTNTLQLGASPQPDALNGSVYERLNAALISSAPLGRSVWLEASGGASMTVDHPQRDVRAEARLSIVVSPELSVSGGGRVAWLLGSDLLGSSGFGWTAFLVVSLNPLRTSI